MTDNTLKFAQDVLEAVRERLASQGHGRLYDQVDECLAAVKHRRDAIAYDAQRAADVAANTTPFVAFWEELNASLKAIGLEEATFGAARDAHTMWVSPKKAARHMCIEQWQATKEA